MCEMLIIVAIFLLILLLIPYIEKGRLSLSAEVTAQGNMANVRKIELQNQLQHDIRNCLFYVFLYSCINIENTQIPQLLLIQGLCVQCWLIY